jgi:hypothetical protein
MAFRAEWRSLLGRISRRKALPKATHAVHVRGAAVNWKPHAGASPAVMVWLRSRNPHVAFVAGALLGTLIIGVSAWLVGGHTLGLPSPAGARVADTTARLEQITAAVRLPFAQQETERAAQEQVAHLVADEEVVELRVGQRVRLAARVDDVDALKPETLVVISGLPEGVQLSDGIRINTQLWMLRPQLLSYVELEAARAAVGRYPVSLDLRTPDGHVVSSAQTTLVVVAAVEDNPVRMESPALVAGDRQLAEPALQDKPAPTANRARVPAKPQTVRTVRPVKPLKPLTRSPVRSAVSRPEPVVSPKPMQKTKPARQDATVSPAPPVVAQGPQSQQKLVWPGDNPRATYTQNPPLFLGGALPNAAPQEQPAPARDENWRQRAFTPGH